MNVDFKRWVDLYIGAPLVVLLFPVVRLVGWILRRDHSLTDVRSIGFVKLMGGGSLTMLYGPLLSLKRKRPEIKLILLCSPAVKKFAELLGVFDDYIVIDDRSVFKLAFSAPKALSAFSKKVQISVDLELHSRLTTIFTTLAAAKSRIGLITHLSIWRRRLYSHSLLVHPQSNIYTSYDAICSLFGVEPLAVEDICDHWRTQSFPVPKSLPKKYFVFGIGCSGLSVERKMPTDLWVDMIHRLSKEFPNHEFLFVGAPADDLDIRAVQEKLPQELTPFFRNLAGKTSLEEVVGLLKNTEATLAIDSAILHLARWSGQPVVGFWGPTRPSQLLRKLPVEEIHFDRNLNCSPCVHITITPPCQGKNICMQHQDHVSASIAWLKTRKPKPNRVNKVPLGIVFGPTEKSEFIGEQVK